MDAYSVSFTSAPERTTSRIWEDLKSHHRATVAELGTDGTNEEMEMGTKISKRRARSHGRKPHIGVIGAGLAGLRCADILLQHHFRVTLIEGRNRLGGRVHQATLPSGRLVDAGPNWIHGTNNNPIMELAKQTNTAVGSWDNKNAVVDDAGKLLSSADASTYSTIMWDIITAAFAHSNENCATISPNESLWDFFQQEVAKRIPDSTSDFELKRKSVHQLAESWGAFVGNHFFTQSLKFFWLEECIDGENLFCADTYKKILEAIAKPAVEGASFRYETVVKMIRSTDEDGDALRVYTDGGETLEFDEVVVTAPLGWLKQHPQAFDPPITPRLTKAISSIGYGCLEKVYISFPKAFWQCPDQQDPPIQGFCQWLSPNYAPDSNPKKWNQEAVELASLSPSTSQPTLLFYTYGEQSKFLTSEVAKLPSEGKRDAFLYDWYKPYYSKLPHYDEASADCRPTGWFATDWVRDDLAGNGSYANFQVGLEEGDRDIEVMREGLPERGLWLAGEHTAPFVALGTVTGAYWSGEAVGRRIAQAYCRGTDGVTVVA
ncbi:Uu.00g100240.m01.CDS01 [Anthostomella pinea]|uniref:Uu.00g100240.m01.CDS01 n=1 Tax=Anthostomella pinea TaxID=933095 RepID=A0AAI8VCT6_9PEZI|nr:Uu.00g100240.m01.CDS01 [Anthostomella pinea]